MAGPYYYRTTDGDDGDSGLSWELAKATFGACVALAAAGERIYVDKLCKEVLTVDAVYAFAGTEGVPVEVIVVETDTTTAVSDYNCTNQYIEGHTNSKKINISGEVYFWGICLKPGLAHSALNAAKTTIMEKSKLDYSIGGGYNIWLSTNNSTAVLIDSDIEFDNILGRNQIQYSTNLVWHGGKLTGNQTNLFRIGLAIPRVEIIGVDLSDMAGGTIFEIDEGDECPNAILKGIKLNASHPALITAGISPERRAKILMDIADNGNTVYKFRREYQFGYAQDETSKVITGKALYDGTNEFTAKMVSRATPTTNFYNPWRYHLTTLRETGFAASRTYTVHIAQDHADTQPAALNNDEIWLEVVYPDDSTAQFNIKTDKIATPTTTPAAQTTSTETWEGLAATTRLQELSVQIDAADGKNGPVEIWVCLAKESKTVYVCPEVYIS